ncbi:hypothetical protein LG943_13515 [Streptomonospora sp. S1-112]|uniref:Uncharacterized protein n=1 Tax=Streptomonospora mangrovi TaxID=2883123 RepID=A0A9X3NK75_9ACTN|nr:hypothetical protein [Streptomonospora mangrovi]MDA0565324.1 hypothetical protein [Streptomonospora mangrovi]
MNLKKLLLVAGLSASALFGAVPAYASDVPAPPVAEEPAPAESSDAEASATEQGLIDQDLARHQELLEEAGVTNPLVADPNYTG